MPEMTALAAPKQNFKSLLEVAQHAQAMEAETTLGIHAVYEAALAAKDYPVQVFMQWFINEQVEEEAWTDKLLAKTREATCSGSVSTLDRHLSKILSPDTAGED